MSNSHIYPGAHSVNCYLAIKDCAKAIEFYKKAFNAEEVGRISMPDGSVGHAEIKIENSLLMLSEENEEWGNTGPALLGGTSFSIGLYVKDVDTVFAQALAAGAKQVKAVSDEFYGDRSGVLLDPFGHKWSVATHIKDVSFAEMQKLTEQMFS